VPEPSPLYWEALRRGVSRRIAEEGRHRPRVALLVTLTAAAAVAAVLLTRPPAQRREAAPMPPQPLVSWSALPPVEEDDGLRVLEGLAAANGELAEWSEAGGLGVYLANLSDDESRLVAERLRQGRRGGDS
jgi:hypothetical protein